MSTDAFTFSPRDYGLPSRDDLVGYRIWDMHYHGMGPPYAKSPMQQNEEVFEFVDRMGIEVVCPLQHVGLGTAAADNPSAELDRQMREVFVRWRNRMAGFAWLNPTKVDASLDAMNRWIADGPMIGIKFAVYSTLPCTHPNFVPLIERAAELGAAIYIHAWYIVGGEPRRYDGGSHATASTPRDVAVVAQRYPNIPFICGHAGGDWELGVRTVLPCRNIFLEFAGSDPHSGSVDFAVRELGADRIVWGGHIPSRCYSNELSKVFDADITEAQRKLVLGGNLRRLLAPSLAKKGIIVQI